MMFQLNENTNEFTAIVKNTFINMECIPAQNEPRRRSVPPSCRLCQCDSICDGKLFTSSFDSDHSTYAQTEGSEAGTRTPMSLDDLSPSSFGSPVAATPQNIWSVPPPPSPFVPVAKAPEVKSLTRRLSSKAASFQPQPVGPVAQEANKDHYKKHAAEVMRLAKRSMLNSELVAGVEVSEDESGWSVIVQPNAYGANPNQTELVLNLAKEALLDAASMSKCIYVMGYCGTKPFNMRPQGFEGSFGAMRSASTACWHVFKKGFCRHEANCSKQHPACEVPVRVVVEGVQINSCKRFAGAFQQVVDDLAGSVKVELEKSPYVESVAVSKGTDSQGWTIELTPQREQTVDKDYVLTLAKNALFNASGNSKLAYIMGYATKPFIPKTNGFVSIIGDMQDESRVCWDLYSKGICTRGCACRWEHPECLMPISVVIKEMSYQISLLAAMQIAAPR